MKKEWKKPAIYASFNEEELAHQKDELMFVGDWKQVIWGQS
ncbi:hypothetical protein [Paenibacillus sp. FSL M7-0420]